MSVQVNCDIGERGPHHEEDRQLMELVQIANIACDGHAGDRESVEAFRDLAVKRGVAVSAHVSYPDRPNFGRESMKLPAAELLAALDAQLGLLPGVKLVKFHGALYNDACRDAALAATLAAWLKERGVVTLLAPNDSEIAAAARRSGVVVLREAFVDRRYAWDEMAAALGLAPRKAGGVITDIEEALAQAAGIVGRGRVNVSGDPASPVWKEIKADTLCIHSDSPIAVDLARRLPVVIDKALKAAAASGVRGNIRLVRPGFCGTAGLPVYGRQDIGVSPAGAMDRFALRRGNLMLGNPEGAPALEIVGPPELEFLTAGRFALTGAALEARLARQDGSALEVDHSRVYEAEAGDRLTFGGRRYGMYTYLSFRGREGGGLPPGEAVPFVAVGGWTDPNGRIRVLPGPEYKLLKQPAQFFITQWRTTIKMDRMGMHLSGEPGVECRPVNMISGPVADGTVQLTPDGPIILLRHRQTTGGYPRVFSVISADVDMLAQYNPGQAIHFAQVTLDEARDIARRKEEALDKIRAGLAKDA